MRVLVTDGEERSALAACRGLARAGHSVGVAAGRRPAPAHWSRACATKIVLPPSLDGEAFAVSVATALLRGSYDALIPGSDAALLALSRFRAHLPGGLLTGLPPHDAVLRSLDKRALAERATAFGFASPETEECASRHEAHQAAHRLAFPLVVKPASSLVSDRTGVRREPARLVSARSDFDAALTAVGMPVLVQRFHENAPVLSLGGVVSRRSVLAAVATLWRRRWPPLAGAASFCETVFPSRALVEKSEALLHALGWQGIFELELLDLGRGRLAPIDLNPRPFGWMALSLRAGTNLPAIWIDWLVSGAERPRVAARAGLRYRWEEGELRHLLWQARHGRARAAAAVLRPNRGVVHAYFERTDPAPLAAAVVDVGRRAAGRLLTRT